MTDTTIIMTIIQPLGRHFNIINNFNIKQTNISSNKVIVSKCSNSKQISKNKEISSNNKEEK